VAITSILFGANANKTAHDAVATAAADVQTIDGIAYSSKTPLTVEAADIVQIVGARGVRVAVYDSAGRLVAGDRSLPGLMRSSGARPDLASGPGPANYTIVKVSRGIVAIAPAGNIGQGLAGYWLVMFVLGGAALVIAWLVGRNLATQSLRPVSEVTVALEKLAEGDFSRRTFVMEERSEVGSLASAYNAAADKVAAVFAQRDSTESRMRQFIGDAGHELRTPLTVIMGYVDVLRRGAVHEAELALKILETISGEGGRMRSLIDELLTLARLEDVVPVEVREVDLAGVVADVVESFRKAEPARLLTWTAAPGLKVMGDESELRAAIVNLVENALKYAPDSPVDVSVKESGDTIALTVADIGRGMTAQERAHAFDRFFRGDNRGVATGVGLGLAIVKRTVERAGGSVELDTVPGEGTRVTMLLRKM
jgi:two-component system OmpR family sensor kinase